MSASQRCVPAVGLLLGLLACAPQAERAQLPRHLVSPSTVTVGVLDLEVLSEEAVQTWSAALDPQGEYAYRVDDLHWSLEALRREGARKWVWMVEDDAPGACALVQADTGADPTALLGALWDTASVLEWGWPVESVALLEWQPGWWVIESPDLRVPAWQAQEHGASWQTQLAKATHAPLRIAFQVTEERQGAWQELGAHPWMRAWLGPLAQPLAALRGGSLILDHQGPSPRVYLNAEFASREDAQLAQELGRDGLKALHRWGAEWLRGTQEWAIAFGAEDRRDQLLPALDHVLEEVRLRRTGPFLELTLDQHFFGAVRHLRNLQTQEEPSAPARLSQVQR